MATLPDGKLAVMHKTRFFTSVIWQILRNTTVIVAVSAVILALFLLRGCGANPACTGIITSRDTIYTDIIFKTHSHDSADDYSLEIFYHDLYADTSVIHRALTGPWNKIDSISVGDTITKEKNSNDVYIRCRNGKKVHLLQRQATYL